MATALAVTSGAGPPAVFRTAMKCSGLSTLASTSALILISRPVTSREALASRSASGAAGRAVRAAMSFDAIA